MISLRMAIINIRQQSVSINFYIPFILSFVVFTWTAEPLKKFVIDNGYNLNASFIVFLTSNPLIVLVIFLGEILLFSQLPFRDKNQPFLLIRSGKKKWVISQIFYVAMISFFYPIVLILLMWLTTSSIIYFDFSQWGKLIYYLSDNPISTDITSLTINKFVTFKLTPIQSTAYFVAIFVLLGYMIGCIQFFFNFITNKYLGNIIALSLLFLFLFSQFASGTFITWISPISWSSFFSLQISFDLYPSFKYSLFICFFIDLFLTLCSILLCRKKAKINFI